MENNVQVAAYNAAYYFFESEFMFLVAFLLASKKKRRSPHRMYRRREEEGALSVLVDRHIMDDDTKFKEYFRLTPFLFSELLNVLEPDLQGIPTTWIRKPMTPRHKLCITLRYLATGESFRSLAFQYRVHYSTIGRIVDKCLASIIKNFLGKAIPTPTTSILQRNIENYFIKWNFPNCCGAIDGKHFRIKCPPKAGSSFFNYKDFHSIVLLAIVDANYKFVALDCGSYGREGDAGIILKCEMMISSF